MKSVKTVATLALLLSASTSLAKTPRFLRQIEDKIKKSGLVTKEKRALAPQCINFSGKWQGRCVDEKGDVEEETITIDQDECDSLIQDVQEYPIGGAVTHISSPSEERASSNTIASAWNDSQTKLNQLITLNVGNGSMAVIFNRSMWMVGDQLRTEMKSSSPIIGVTGPIQDYKWDEFCTYDRVTSGQ